MCAVTFADSHEELNNVAILLTTVNNPPGEPVDGENGWEMVFFRQQAFPAKLSVSFELTLGKYFSVHKGTAGHLAVSEVEAYGFGKHH